jgi:CMP-N-acetylneuraminic acid synthetase
MIALIPFRSGSERVPDKSIRIFDRNGVKKPLFLHTVRLAVECFELFDAIIITTDYSLGLLHSLSYNTVSQCQVVVRDKVSSDQPASEYIKDVLDSGKSSDEQDVCLLQITCPLRAKADIYQAADIYYMNKDKCKTLVSVTEVDSIKKFYMPFGNTVSSLYQGGVLSCDESDGSGDKLYRRNSSIYIFNVVYFRENNSIFSPKPSYYEMPAHRSVDINTEEDFKMAEALSKVCGVI